MAAIRCTPILRTALRAAGRSCAHPPGRGARRHLLGSWAATLIRVEDKDLVVALNERTYLTVVFPLTPTDAFRRAFVEALDGALRDHDVPEDRIPPERGQVESAAILPLHDPALRVAIDTAGFIAGIEVRCCSSLREVQWNLNQFPHESIGPLVPTQHVRLLFGPRNGRAVPSFPRRVSLEGRDCVEELLRTRAASERIAAEAEARMVLPPKVPVRFLGRPSVQHPPAHLPGS